MDGQPLQIAIQTEAYLVKEKYEGFEPLIELTSMLSAMARRPKSLREQIQEATLDTIILNINKANNEQLSWFSALLTYKVKFTFFSYINK